MTNVDDPQPPINPRAAAYGEALRRLRRDSGVSQVDAARAAGLSQAAWTKYERGRTLAFLNLLNQEKCVTALGRTLDELEAARAAVEGGVPEIARGVPDGVEEGGVPFVPWPAAGDTRVLVVADDALAPYADAGDTIVYSLSMAPRLDRGVVLKMRDGRLLIRRYGGADADRVACARLEAVKTDQGLAWAWRDEEHPRDGIEGMYAVLRRETPGRP